SKTEHAPRLLPAFHADSACVLALLALRLLFRSTASARSTHYILSLHDALPILPRAPAPDMVSELNSLSWRAMPKMTAGERVQFADRKSTRLNSSHLVISYAVFCLKKKK